MLSSKYRSFKGFTLIELLVVIAIIAILFALLVPAVQKARGVSIRTQCMNNVKNISLATHSCHDTHNRLPPGIGFFPARDEGAYGTGLFHVLPYLDQQALYDSSKAKNWFWGPSYAPPGVDVKGTPVRVFLCPSDPSPVPGGVARDDDGKMWGVGNYAGNVQVFCEVESNGYFKAPQGNRSLWQIPDGTSTTIFYAEKYGRCVDPLSTSWPVGGSFWAYDLLGRAAQPYHAGFAISWLDSSVGVQSMFQVQPPWNKCDPTSAATPHSVMIAGMGDGSAKMVSGSINRASWWALCTPDAGDVPVGF